VSRKDKGEEPQIEVRKSIVIESTPEVIFKAITNQSDLTNWLPDLSIPDPRIGGKISIVCHKGTRWEVNNETKVLDRDYFFEGIIKEFNSEQNNIIYKSQRDTTRRSRNQS